MQWIRNNWFRISLVFILIVSVGLATLFVYQQDLEARSAQIEAKAEEADRAVAQVQEARAEAQIRAETASKAASDAAAKSKATVVAHSACVSQVQNDFLSNMQYQCHKTSNDTDGICATMTLDDAVGYGKYANTINTSDPSAKLYTNYTKDLANC